MSDAARTSHKPTDVFASGAYWQEYYASLGQENAVVGAFLLETARPLAQRGALRILDAGCGPTALYWTLFVPGRNEVHGFDANEANIRAAWRQIDDLNLDAGTADAGLIEAAGSALARLGLSRTPTEHVEDKARQIRSLRRADLAARWPYEDSSFDLVQSCFALECLPNPAAIDTALREAHRVLRAGGVLALANVAQASRWICDGQEFPTQRFDGPTLDRRLAQAGFATIAQRDVASSDAEHRDQGYSRLLLTAATR